ncbi:hypothetical protein DOY81_011532, partial [Sarcophaga bullata]
SNSENNKNIRDLNEILIVSNPQQQDSTINPKTKNNSNNFLTISDNNEVMSTIPTSQTAPIAREEDAEEEEIEENFENHNNAAIKSKDVGDYEECQQQQQQQHGGQPSIDGNTKSSRVRNYLKKCKNRWLAVGLHNQMQEYNGNADHDPKSTMSAINELSVSQDLRPNIVRAATNVTVNASNRLMSLGGDCAACDCEVIDSVNKVSSINCALGNLKAIKENENYVEDFEDDVDDDSYEDIDFGLGSTLTKTAIATATHKSIACNSAQIETRQEKKHFMKRKQQHNNNIANDQSDGDDETRVEQLDETVQMESHIAALIDSHFACIYPVFTTTTRAVLIREARDVLVKNYHGCLATFEREFLFKFKEIAVILKERHRIGE